MILLLLLEIIVTIIIKIIIKSKARLVFSNVLIRMIRKSQFFTHSKSNKKKSYTQVVTTIKIRHSGLASLCMCTTSFESSKSNISWTPGVIFCMSDLVNRLSIYDEEGSHNTRYSLIFVPHFRWIFFSSFVSSTQHRT